MQISEDVSQFQSCHSHFGPGENRFSSCIICVMIFQLTCLKLLVNL